MRCESIDMKKTHGYL